MMIDLTESELRVLACLIEKEATTPDNYPLTLNAVTAACSQKSNRDPVVEYDSRMVVRALDGLREKKLAWMVHSAGSRVPKYDHRFREMMDLPPEQIAVLCVLMLRGPQTAGELKGRCSRLHTFDLIVDVEVTLQQLITRDDGALVVELPRQHGTREPRFMHLFRGEPDMSVQVADIPVEAARRAVDEENRKIEALADDVAALKETMAALQAEFAAFKSQFE